MVDNAVLELSQYFKCQRCGGQVLRSYDDLTCLQCGASHTREGILVAPTCLTQEDITGRRRHRSTPRNLLKIRPSKI